jgi:hypothetical protein
MHVIAGNSRHGAEVTVDACVTIPANTADAMNQSARFRIVVPFLN